MIRSQRLPNGDVREIYDIEKLTAGERFHDRDADDPNHILHTV